VPAVNNLRTLGRWAFAELTEIYQIDADFRAKVDSEFDAMIVRAAGVSPAISGAARSRIETVTDEGDLEEVYDTERHLLYVACTRARDHLLVTGVSPASEFLQDLGRHLPASP
jgi:ATP-dependent exoDNAse (exonuclease V) beta subunit